MKKKIKTLALLTTGLLVGVVVARVKRKNILIKFDPEAISYATHQLKGQQYGHREQKVPEY